MRKPSPRTLAGKWERRSVCRALEIIALAAILPFLAAVSVAADVIVLANRTGQKMSVMVTPATGHGQKVTLPAGDSVPIFLDGHAQVEFVSRGRPKRYQLDADSAYYFGQGGGGSVD